MTSVWSDTLMAFRLEFAFWPLDANLCDKSQPGLDFGPLLFLALIVVSLESFILWYMPLEERRYCVGFTAESEEIIIFIRVSVISGSRLASWRPNLWRSLCLDQF